MKTTTNINKIIILFFLLLSIGVTSCKDTSPPNKSADKSQFKTEEAAINSIYNDFLYEKTVCQNFVTTIAKDEKFIKTFENLDYRERESGKRVFEMLSQSKVAKDDIIQYVLRNRKYFLIDVDFHGGPGMTYVKDSPIFCAQTDKRLKEIENLGPSEQAWKVREYYLNFDLKNLLQIGMPWSEGGGVSYDFNTLMAEVDKAKKLYSQQFKEPLKGWVQKASTQLKEKSLDPASEQHPNEQQLKEIESWIIELNKGLQ